MNSSKTLPRALGCLAAGAALLGTTLAAPLAGLPASSTTGAAATCQPDDLYVVKGTLEGAAGGRYLKVRIRNVGDGPCTAGLATRAGFRDWTGQLATGDLSSGGTITLKQGATVRTTIHWSDPGPVPEADCHPEAATLTTLRVPSLGHTWRLPLRAKVCTTPAYAPDSRPLR